MGVNASRKIDVVPECDGVVRGRGGAPIVDEAAMRSRDGLLDRRGANQINVASDVDAGIDGKRLAFENPQRAFDATAIECRLVTRHHGVGERFRFYDRPCGCRKSVAEMGGGCMVQAGCGVSIIGDCYAPWIRSISIRETRDLGNELQEKRVTQ